MESAPGLRPSVCAAPSTPSASANHLQLSTLQSPTDAATPAPRANAKRWSLFSRGGSQAALSPLQEPDFQKASGAFWDALADNDVATVRGTLKAMSILQRERLLMTPSPDADLSVWLPKLPLCRTVAAGQLAMTEALLDFEANPWMGDPWVGGGAQELKQPAATPAYWSVIYGQRDTLRAVYKVTRNTLDARRALCQTVNADVLSWVVDKGVTSDQLAPAMLSAIGRDDGAGVRLLAQVGKADVNAMCPTSDNHTSLCSLLAYALGADKYLAAEVLVEFGAKPANRKADPASKDGRPEENLPLTMAIRKGQVGLVTQMLQVLRKDSELQKAIPGGQAPISENAYLLAAFEAPNIVQTYMAMYRAGLRPKDLVETASLLALAKEKNLELLYALITRQRTLLLLDSEKGDTAAAKRMARTALEHLADALSEDPNHICATRLLDHAQAMNLETVVPSRGMFKVFSRWSAKKGKQAGDALTDVAANAIAPAGPYGFV